MIVEEFPEIRSLPAEKQLALAAELFELATDSSPETPDPQIVELLNARLAEHRKNPEGALPWTEVYKRLLEERNYETRKRRENRGHSDHWTLFSTPTSLPPDDEVPID